MPQISTDLPRYHVIVGTPVKGRLLLSSVSPFGVEITFFPSANNVSIKSVSISEGASGADFTIEATAPGLVTVTSTTSYGNLSFEVDAVPPPIPRRRASGH